MVPPATRSTLSSAAQSVLSSNSSSSSHSNTRETPSATTPTRSKQQLRSSPDDKVTLSPHSSKAPTTATTTSTSSPDSSLRSIPEEDRAQQPPVLPAVTHLLPLDTIAPKTAANTSLSPRVSSKNNSPPASPMARGRRPNRSRTRSDDIPRVVGGEAEPHPPPPHVYPEAMMYGYPAAYPPLPPPSPQHHTRTRSWSVGVPPPHPPAAAATTPPRPEPQRGNGQRHHSERKSHRKSYSVDHSHASYGAIQHASPQQQQRFSPRSEFRKLALSSSVNTQYQQQQLQQQQFHSHHAHPHSPLILYPHAPAQNGHGHNGNSRRHRRTQSGEAVHLLASASSSVRSLQQVQKGDTDENDDDDDSYSGRSRAFACQDVLFLLLYVFHILGVIMLGNLYAPLATSDGQENNNTLQDGGNQTSTTTTDDVVVNYENLLYIATVSGGVAMLSSAAVLTAMTFTARNFIPVALLLTIALSFAWGTAGIAVSPHTLVPVTGILALAWTVAYALIVWDRIPLAGANLATALQAVHGQPWTLVVALMGQLLVGLASIYYAVVACGVYDALQSGVWPVEGDGWKTVIYVGLALSYYWTFQVLQHLVQVATASLVGEWWHDPDSQNGMVAGRAFFYNMGSICLGSLLVEPVRLLKQFSSRPADPQSTTLLCLPLCLHFIQAGIATCVDATANRFNSWGFCLVGLYGTNFVGGSLEATDLFASRGWTVMVSDDLVNNVLHITSLAIGGVTGCFAHFLSQRDSLHVASLEQPGLTSFLVGLTMGWVLTSVLFSVISGSVNTVVVLFAARPADFAAAHPDLSQELRSAWRRVYPGVLGGSDRMSPPELPNVVAVDMPSPMV